MFRSSHFWFLVTFGNKVTKVRKYYVIFVYILRGKMDKTEKTQKKNQATKVIKIPKTQKTKIWDERNNKYSCKTDVCKNVCITPSESNVSRCKQIFWTVHNSSF